MLVDINSIYYQTQRRLINLFSPACFELTRSSLSPATVCKLVTYFNSSTTRRRDLFPTTHNTYHRRTSMPPVGFELPNFPISVLFSYLCIMRAVCV
jgi:hypothetical protein